MNEKKEYIVRVEGLPYSYGLGEVVSEGVAYFPKGNYNLNKEELNAKLKALAVENSKHVPNASNGYRPNKSIVERVKE